jgi:hypothetical protein
MGKLIVVIVIVGAVAYAWNQGLIQKWFGQAVDSSVQNVQDTRRSATHVRPIDGAADKK